MPVKKRKPAKKSAKKTAAKKKLKALVKKAHKKIKQGVLAKHLDRKHKAKKPGKRKSKSGKTYYESRVNRSDKHKYV